MKSYVQKKLSKERYEHTIFVVKQALKLADYYKLDTEKVEKAALLHDIAKEFNEQELLQNVEQSDILFHTDFLNAKPIWHAFAGGEFVRKHLGVQDEEIINAIKYHTTGRQNMSDIEKVIFLSDLTEDSRKFEGIDFLREQLFVSLDTAMYYALKHTLLFLLKSRVTVYPQTVLGYNFYLEKKEY